MIPQNPAVPGGIYCPSISFFTDDEEQEIDLEAQASHAEFLIKAGIHGITIHGTTGESVHLSHDERNAIVSKIAEVRMRLNADDKVTLVVGCSAQSTRETIQMCRAAKKHGGDMALVLPPSYWAKASTPAVLVSFYQEVADKSPLPIIIYSFPAVANSVDMDSDLLSRLADHSNIKGVKLTCGNVGKLTRLTRALSPSDFAVFGGSTDWLIPGMIGGSCGAVTGLANTHPRSLVKLFNLFQRGRYDEAVELQGIVSAAEWAMGRTGMSGTKYAVEFSRRYRNKVLPRRPLVECDKDTKRWIQETLNELSAIETELEGQHRVANGEEMAINGQTTAV